MAIIDDYMAVAHGLEELREPTRDDVCVCERGGTFSTRWRIPSPVCPLHAHECRNGPIINPSS